MSKEEFARLYLEQNGVEWIRLMMEIRVAGDVYDICSFAWK